MPVALEGAIACVSGGARGIGRATAALLAEGGARVWIGDIDAEAAKRTASELGQGVQSAHLDVAEPQSFAAFVAAAQADGPVEVLVNNAGIMPLGTFLEQDPAGIERTIGINLGGVINGMRAALPGMLERKRGHIVNVASAMAKLAVPGAAVYSATKYGVLGLTDAVREEIADGGVTLSTVLPGAVRTDLIAGVPLGRGLPVVDAEDVAAAIVASCANGRHEVYVPRWLGAAGAAQAVAPGRIEGVVRGLMDQRRALTRLDREARRDYDERIG